MIREPRRDKREIRIAIAETTEGLRNYDIASRNGSLSIAIEVAWVETIDFARNYRPSGEARV